MSKDGTTPILPFIITLKSDQIAKGMSGASVLDRITNKVVEIISDRYIVCYATGEEKKGGEDKEMTDNK